MTNKQFFFAVIHAGLDALHELEMLILTGTTADDLLEHIRAKKRSLGRASQTLPKLPNRDGTRGSSPCFLSPFPFDFTTQKAGSQEQRRKHNEDH